MNVRPFQIALLATFGLLAIVAIYLVKVYKPQIMNEGFFYGEEVVVWGTIETNVFKSIQNQILTSDKHFDAVKYYYVDERDFDEELVNAIAEGRSPDLVLLRSDSLVKHRAKLQPISYETISERDFRDRYVDGAEIFARRDGVYAIPFLIDPLVMYWNRDLFATAGLGLPPKTWEEVVASTVPDLTIRDYNRNIIQSAIAFGEYRNVENAKDILITLAIQSGSKLVTETDRGYLVELDKSVNQGDRAPLDATVEFYTNFSNSNSPLYTWNRVQSSDKNAFVAEDLAVYFGFGSEVESIADKNPNLNFDVAEVPQGAGVTTRRTTGHIYGLAIPRAAYNPQGAYAAALTLTSDNNVAAFANALGMSSANRSVVSTNSQNPFRQVVQKAALTVRTWLDPEPVASDTIFKSMIEDVVSNRTRVTNAVSDAIRKLTFEY